MGSRKRNRFDIQVVMEDRTMNVASDPQDRLTPNDVLSALDHLCSFIREEMGRENARRLRRGGVHASAS